MTKFEFIFFVVALLAAWRLLCNDINKTKGEIMAKVSELPAILNGIADRLDKSKTEILAEIETLKTSLDGDISPETQASIDRLSKLSQDLDDLNPDAPAPVATSDSGTGVITPTT